MQCGLCGEEIRDDQAYHYMAETGNVHRTCRKAYERGLHAAAAIIRRHADWSPGAVNPRVLEDEVRAVVSEFSDGE